VGAREAERIAQEIDEQRARFHVDRADLAIDVQRQGDGHDDS
jgi:hypothetical protein